MKIFFLIGMLAVLLMSCGPTLTELQTIYESKNFYAIDFTKYSQSGFLITPEKYQGDYVSIGIVRYEAYPAAKYRLISNTPNPNYKLNSMEPPMVTIKGWSVDKISIQEVLDGIYEKCKEMGADAIINFDVKYDAIPYTGILNPIYINGYIISGFAIKRGK